VSFGTERGARSARQRSFAHGMPQAIAAPPPHTLGSPAAQAWKSQPCSPARPFAHSSMQREPAAQVAVQLLSRHRKWQVLPGPQVQEPFAHVPLQ
jgi:hypothetical protein